MNFNQKILYQNSIGTIYENILHFSKFPDKNLKVNDISFIQYEEIKLKYINDMLYILVVFLLVLDLYFHYSEGPNTIVRELMFLVLIVAINLKIKKRQIRLIYNINKEIIVPIKIKDCYSAKKFINEFELIKRH